MRLHTICRIVGNYEFVIDLRRQAPRDLNAAGDGALVNSRMIRTEQRVTPGSHNWHAVALRESNEIHAGHALQTLMAFYVAYDYALRSASSRFARLRRIRHQRSKP